MSQDMLASSLMRISSVSLCLGRGLLCARTCRHARDCGAPPPRARSTGARPSTCPGQMARPVETICGAAGQSVWTRAVGGGQLWRGGGGSGTGDTDYDKII